MADQTVIVFERDGDPEGFPKALTVSAMDGTGIETAWSEIQELARYRKEKPRSLDEVVITAIQEQLTIFEDGIPLFIKALPHALRVPVVLLTGTDDGLAVFPLC